MRIGELAEASQIPAKTIRYYESVGLMPPGQRLENGYRTYGDIAVERLIFIRRCRELRIPLEQIKLLLDVQTDKTAPCKNIDQIIRNQLTKIRSTIRELQQLESCLSEIGSCDSATVDDCKILRQLSSH